jgi:hypothetical protein
MLENLTPPAPNKSSCKIGLIAEGLSESDKKILLDAVADQERWPVKTLSKALSERGLQVSDSPIYNHRAKTCACYRA